MAGSGTPPSRPSVGQASGKPGVTTAGTILTSVQLGLGHRLGSIVAQNESGASTNCHFPIRSQPEVMYAQVWYMVAPFMYQTVFSPLAVFLQTMSGLPSLFRSPVPSSAQFGSGKEVKYARAGIRLRRSCTRPHSQPPRGVSPEDVTLAVLVQVTATRNIPVRIGYGIQVRANRSMVAPFMYQIDILSRLVACLQMKSACRRR